MVLEAEAAADELDDDEVLLPEPVTKMSTTATTATTRTPARTKNTGLMRRPGP